jgi:ubiquinone biosynthesis protein COQ9
MVKDTSGDHQTKGVVLMVRFLKSVPIVDAAFALMAEKEVSQISMAEVAMKADVPLREVLQKYQDIHDIVADFAVQLDMAMLEEFDVAAYDVAASQDKIFELICLRLEFMDDVKEALRRLAKEYRTAPIEALSAGGDMRRSMKRILEAAGAPTSGLKGIARIKALAGIYLYTLQTWLDDDSEDQGKTLKALDAGLNNAASVAPFLWTQGKTTPSAPADVIAHKE